MHSWHTVAISDLESRPECAHRAHLNPEEIWNGWTSLYFEKPEVERMSEWLAELDGGLVCNELTAPSPLPQPRCPRIGGVEKVGVARLPGTGRRPNPSAS